MRKETFCNISMTMLWKLYITADIAVAALSRSMQTNNLQAANMASEDSPQSTGM